MPVLTRALTKIPELVARVRPCVVQVDFEGAEGWGNGSGFLMERASDDGAGAVVVTNAHVARGASNLWIRLTDGREDEATVRLCDDSTDLALLTITLDPGHALALRPLTDVQIGEAAIAIGSPFGLESTVTAGIISGLGRTMPAPNRVPIENMVQTDALINPGNSGGPLIGLDGRVIGVNDQTIVNPESGAASGLGFAIPSDTVRAVYEEIVETGNDYVIRASLGARTALRSFNFEERRRYTQKAGAVVVADPRSETPAASAGLCRGDIVVAFNGHQVDEPGVLYSALDRHVVNDECALDYIRAGKRYSTTITPAERARTIQ